MGTEKILNHLPQKISNNLKNVSKTILKSINESLQEINDEPIKKVKPRGEINNIKIE
jgi:hypothetical protein